VDSVRQQALEYFEYRTGDFQQTRGKCKLTIVQGNLVDADEKYKMHFVSADMKHSRGVAVAFAEAYGPVDMPEIPLKVGDIYEQFKNGTILLNLVHKEKYFFKFGVDPEVFLSNIVEALMQMKEYCVQNDVKRLALVRVASVTDKVHWRWTQRKILEIFEDVDITLALYLQKRPRRTFHKTTSTPEKVREMSDDKIAQVLESASERLSKFKRPEADAGCNAMSSPISKVIEKAFLNRLERYFETNDLLTSRQHGFRKKSLLLLLSLI
jgi:hypothetical protein